MNQLKRLVSQIFLWLGIWCLLWVSSGSNPNFVTINGPAFLIQVLLLYVAIYFIVPKLLFSKNYTLFILISIGIIVLGAYLTAEANPPPMPERPKGPPVLPSRFFINLLIMAISYVLATLLETFVFAQKKEKDTAFAIAELKENELKFLKMQINPHFLFNALNNIYALSVTNSNKTQESISTLSDMLRYVIYDCEQPEVSLRKEINYISDYINLFKLRSSKAFKISFSKNIEDAMTKVAPMLFVPFIENAFKHSGVEKGGENFVHISLNQNGDSIDFRIENSIPKSPANTDAQGGIGLPNVKKRLEILYPDTHKLEILASETFVVTLNLKTR